MGDRIQAARIRRTREFQDDRADFLDRLSREIAAHERAADRAGIRAAVRLNGTSDLPWETIAPDLFERFSRVQFWDYTKAGGRALRAADWATIRAGTDSADIDGRIGRSLVRTNQDPAPWPENYDLTFSWSGENGEDCSTVLRRGGRVAVPFRGAPPVGDGMIWGADGRPIRYRAAPIGAWPVIDGDGSDLRFLDPPGVVVGLKAKGPAKADASGWVIR